jgi:hypothetical protein
MVGRPENRQLVTGQHVVADISCSVCAAKLGWKYVDAKEASQKYKVGKFILETQRVGGWRSWEDVERGQLEEVETGGLSFWKKFSFGSGKDRRRGHEFVAEDDERRASGDSVASASSSSSAGIQNFAEEEEIEFDSEDEDECEDIFAGVWNAKEVAARRRLNAAKAHGKKAA